MESTTHELIDETTIDALLGGRVRLQQPRVGYRAGMDAALLAAAVRLADGERGLEAGCGAGGALLQVAARCPGAHLTGIERDPAALALARCNVTLNGADKLVSVQSGAVEAGFRALGLAQFAVAFANPPFFDDPSTLRAPHPARREAWMADTGLAAWTRFLLKTVGEHGRIVIIHRADRLADLLTLLGESAGSFRIRPVHPFADAPAKRVLVQAIKAGRAPLSLLPSLVLHNRGAQGRHTTQAEAILRGEAALGFESSSDD